MQSGIGLAEDRLAQPRHAARNVITVEAFIRADSDRCDRAIEYLTQLTNQHEGLQLVVHDVLKEREQLRRLWSLSKSQGHGKAGVPAILSCGRLHMGFDDAELSGPKIADLFTIHIYTRSTCHRCAMAKDYLKQLQSRWPGLRVEIYEITTDADARSRLSDLTERFRVTPGIPAIHFAGRLLVGYQGDSVTGAEIESLLKTTNPQPEKRAQIDGPQVITPVVETTRQRLRLGRTSGIWQSNTDTRQLKSRNKQLFFDRQTFVVALALISQVSDGEAEPKNTDSVPLPAGMDEVPLPADIDDIPIPDTIEDVAKSSDPENLHTADDPRAVDDSIDVPVFGELSPGVLGMPAFTFLVGLVDGFNPCAMWVLVFLLSVLVNVKDRRRMAAIAGAFVIISGLAYFTFMAAWLNIFVLIGIARPVQLTLGCMAVFIGAVNVKDFFRFKKGLSFSIPESQKPAIYARVRNIVSAKYLTTALWGAAVLAILVNIVELLCTAGLPALYSQILLMQKFPAWLNYFYLGLYNLAYMLDDSILLAIVVVTLSHRRLQEREGRWLKLMSGVVILALGMTMIFQPQWLQLSG